MIDLPLDTALIRGVAELESTARGVLPHRLPGWVRAQFPDPQLLGVESQPAGVRVVLRTAATRIELELHATRSTLMGVGRARGRVDVFVDGALHESVELTGGDTADANPMTGARSLVEGPSQRIVVSPPEPGTHLVELWLPHNEVVELVSLRADAPVLADAADAADTAPVRRWVHHGSSISHGSNAVAPSGTWVSVAARLAGLELRNLGVGGSAQVDPFMARVIRDAPADVVSVKLGINVVNADAMRRRAFVPAVHGFLDTIRDGHPETPLYLVTPIFCGIHEQTPGPGALDPEAFGCGELQFTATGTAGDTAMGRLTLEAIRDALGEVFAHRDDPNLHLVDGLGLYGAADAERLPLPDGLHPSPEAHQLIGERFAAQVFGVE